MTTWRESAALQQEMTQKDLRTLRLTTVALEDDQHLKPVYHSSIVETYCKGFTNGKRDKTLDGHYFTKELTVKSPSMDEMPKDSNLFIK